MRLARFALVTLLKLSWLAGAAPGQVDQVQVVTGGAPSSFREPLQPPSLGLKAARRRRGELATLVAAGEPTARTNSSPSSSSEQTDPTQPAGAVLELSALQAAQQGYFRHSVGVSVILTVAYTIVFVVGIVGNSFVVAIVCKSPRMRTVTNYFIANLAFADILVLLFCLPATLVGNLFIRKYLIQSEIPKLAFSRRFQPAG